MGLDKFRKRMDITVYDHYMAVTTKLVSLIRELENAIGKEKTHELVSKWAESNAVEDIKNVMAAENAIINTFEDVKVLLRRWVADLNESMETVAITEETEDKSTCIVTECIYGKVFNDLDAADLGYLLHCRHDFAATPHIHPRLKLKRKKTLMQGHECCDFEYYWDGDA
ncbi:MAG: hypothetical protein EAX95_08750 [Candidatus Thorarchaeota archaeon]|nr:hypothetical protein [Candidatus Thorarchaeota archaeon]